MQYSIIFFVFFLLALDPFLVFLVVFLVDKAFFLRGFFEGMPEAAVLSAFNLFVGLLEAAVLSAFDFAVLLGAVFLVVLAVA